MLHQPFLRKRYLSFHNIKQLEKKININNRLRVNLTIHAPARNTYVA
jgi:hypothetical protein